MSEDKPTRPLLGPKLDHPKAMIQKTGKRGFMAWKSWVDIGEGMIYGGEYGTYSWSRRMAVWKSRRLLKKYLRIHNPGPEIEV